MQLHVAILDDVAEDAQHLQSVLEHSGEAIESITCFSSADMLINHADLEAYDIFFLDICMEGTNGLMAAETIRQRRPGVPLVFVTSSPEYVWQAFPVHPFDYLLKPYADERVGKVLRDLCALLHQTEPELEVRFARQTITMPFGSIYYAVAQNHVVRVMTDKGECRATEIFSSVQRQLSVDPRFLVCNRGIIINMSAVLRFEEDCIQMLDGTQFPVRQKDKSSLMATFMQYQFRQMRRETPGGQST